MEQDNPTGIYSTYIHHMFKNVEKFDKAYWLKHLMSDIFTAL